MTLSDDALETRFELALSAAREAGRKTLEFFRSDSLAVELKADSSPVTVADRQAELLLRERIGNLFPDDGIVGEEFGQQQGATGFRWILDPIDGTKSFVSGVPLYGTLVGVEYDGRSVIGVIDIPALEECVYAATGRGCWYLQGTEVARQTRVSKTPRLDQGLLVTTQIDSFAVRDSQAAFESLQRQAGITRTWGDCYGYLLVVTGRGVAMVDPLMNIWDAAALQPVLEEAGGTFTDWRGEPTIHSGEGVATNGAVLQEVLQATRLCPRLPENPAN